MLCGELLLYMKFQEFQHFLTYVDSKLADKPDTEKIRAFIEWCKENNYEQLILRLSAEKKGTLVSAGYCLDFTTRRIIISKKGMSKFFLDIGYVAGMAPIPFMVLSKKLRTTKINKQMEIMDPDRILRSNLLNFEIRYSDIEQIILRKGVETTIRNMMGTIIRSNFLRIQTLGNMYDFSLPASKNGPFETLSLWLGVLLPIKIT